MITAQNNNKHIENEKKKDENKKNQKRYEKQRKKRRLHLRINDQHAKRDLK